jgi:PAS domain S-box-containing protein
MDKEIKILIAEDSQADAELITRELGKGDFAHTTKWVKSKEEFLQALGEYAPDVIFCDYNMPGFGAPEALEIIKERLPAVPFIVISGTIGEDIAVEMLKSGATDYVMKNNLPKLASAVQRALKEAQERTERKRAEESVHLSAQNWQNTFDAVSDAMWLLSADSRILRSNKAAQAMFGLKADEILGRYCYEVIHGTDKPHPECPIARMRSSGHRETADFFIDGRWLSVTVDPFFDPTGSLAGIVHVVTDVTGRKQAEEAVEKLANIKSKFTAVVSHELRSPLAVVQEALDIVSEGIVGSVNSEQKDILNMAKKNIHRLSRLINDVLDFKKIESGKMEFDIRENDLKNVVTEVCDIIRILAKKKGLDLRLETDEVLPEIKFDRDKVIQVIMNLVNNAVANTQTGSVTLGIQKENDVVHVRVRDTGAGISAEDLPRLFQPFEQLDAGKGRAKGGTGLGLAITKEIILAHHGKIWVESELGKGSTFHFVLPIQERRG